MKINDQFRFVLQNMKKNKTRVFMTILATAMGCAFLIVLASVGFGIHKSVIKDMTEQSLVTEIEVHGKETKKGNFQQITDKDIKEFEQIDKVKAVTRRVLLSQSGNFKIANYQTDAETIVAHMPSEIKAGFELSKGRLPKNKNEVVVGYHFVTNLLNQDAIDKEAELYNENGEVKKEFRYKDELTGKQINLTVSQFEEGKKIEKEIPLTIVGISKKPTKEWVRDQTVFISEEILKEIEAFTGTPRGMINDPTFPDADFSDITTNEYDQVKLYANNIGDVKSIAEKLDAENYATYSIVNEMEEINMIFTIIKAGLIFIGTIAILIASIGIYNTMTMAVTERAPDIGIMKAIGANPKTIKNIFLLESSFIGLVGALIGTLVSYGISYAVNKGLPFIIEQVFEEQLPKDLIFSSIPWSLPVICFAITYLVTIISGHRPAKRATEVDVLRAMRREV